MGERSENCDLESDRQRRNASELHEFGCEYRATTGDASEITELERRMLDRCVMGRSWVGVGGLFLPEEFRLLFDQGERFTHRGFDRFSNGEPIVSCEKVL